MATINPLTGKSPQQSLQAAQVGLTGYETQDADKYRNITSGGKRDLTPLSFRKAQEMAYYEHQRYPLARKMIEILMDFTTGEDMQVKLKVKKRGKENNVEVPEKSKDAQNIWDEFWNNPINDMEGEFPVIVQDCFLAGETVLPAAVNEANGDVLLGYMDPGHIKEVVCLPTNQRVITDIIMEAKDGAEGKRFKVIRYDTDPNSQTFKKLQGEVFYFRVNYVMSQKRGYSELTEYLDWLDAFEQFLFATLKGFDARNAHFYDVTMEGKTQEELDKKTIAPPGQGEVKLHNEKVIWDIKTPDLKAVDATAATKLIKNFITGTKGFPDMWFGDASESNLATAQVMTQPTMRMLKRKQKTVKRIIKAICSYVIQQAETAGKLSIDQDNERLDIEVSMFDVERKDAAVISSAFVQLGTALSVAVSKNWITNETAKKVVDGILNMLGIEIDPNETPEKVKEKNKTGEEEEVLEDGPPINDFLK